jgi:hypothetical protein
VDLGRPLLSSGAESSMDILALLGEDVGFWALQYHAISTLDLPVCMRVGDRNPVHTDVIVITEI